ncbi:hypothetical protein L248_0015 [Schleiferilactobacillus shenzhenensis LY-73]|uniref:Uncharacterized protein n=1 Tax=Schleiferilactobacillus shenzhenensis LY-73 TaxID=1231336 RepID=U4TX02_9LACO|nr:hypothetical protein L248_0015 [Schleiferilactobacillus shenzhenensis LY-73]
MRQTTRDKPTKLSLISIHAPPKRMRRISVGGPENTMGFQFTHPPRGCDANCKRGTSGCRNFNSRTPQEDATVDTIMQTTPYNISIHAPPKRMRRMSKRGSVLTSIFQFTHPPRGCDIMTAKWPM